MAFMAVLGLRRFCEEEALAKDDLFFGAGAAQES
jgi:hypothetical protein